MVTPYFSWATARHHKKPESLETSLKEANYKLCHLQITKLGKAVSTNFRSKIINFFCSDSNRCSACICIRTQDTGCSFEPIFTKFTLLVRIYSRINPTVTGKNQHNGTTQIFFLFNSDKMTSVKKNALKQYSEPHFPQKGLFNFIVECPFPTKMIMPLKTIFHSYFIKYCFFRRTC